MALPRGVPDTWHGAYRGTGASALGARGRDYIESRKPPVVPAAPKCCTLKVIVIKHGPVTADAQSHSSCLRVRDRWLVAQSPGTCPASDMSEYVSAKSVCQHCSGGPVSCSNTKETLLQAASDPLSRLPSYHWDWPWDNAEVCHSQSSWGHLVILRAEDRVTECLKGKQWEPEPTWVLGWAQGARPRWHCQVLSAPVTPRH